MQRLMDFVRKLINREVQADVPQPLPEPILVPLTLPANRSEAATRPTRRIDDNELLKLHKAIDMAG